MVGYYERAASDWFIGKEKQLVIGYFILVDWHDGADRDWLIEIKGQLVIG